MRWYQLMAGLSWVMWGVVENSSGKVFGSPESCEEEFFSNCMKMETIREAIAPRSICTEP